MIILDLIQQIQRVAVVVINRLKDADDALQRFQAFRDVFFLNAHDFRQLRQRRLTLVRMDERFLFLQHLVRQILQMPRDPDHLIIPQVALNLADDHRDGVG